MSTLRDERVGSEIPEPDSELRAALQRVARDFEHDNRHLGQEQDLGLQQDKHGDGLHRIRNREGTSIHVEDILDQSALEELEVDDVTPYGIPGTESEAPDASSHHIHRLSPQSPTDSGQQLPQRQDSDSSGHATSRIGDTGDGGNGGIVQTLLESTPTIGFMNFLDDWLESQELKSADGPSPVREAWKSLDDAQRSGHDARAKYQLDMRRSAGSSLPGQSQSRSRSSADQAGNKRRFTRDAAGSTNGGIDTMERGLEIGEKRAVDGFVKNIVQQLDILYQVSGTNYLLLTAPVFQPADSFPVLSHSPPAEGFWQGLRGGPGTNLTKFLALSHPAVTSRRLAIPSGERSLDVKARLNASMRQMIREASDVADAEMKWTRPESLVQIYGVKIVGWPMGGPGETDEMVPMRNPSNNSVAQNKLLLNRIEAGILRVELATDVDRCLAFGTPSLPSDLQDPAKIRDLRAGPGIPTGSTGQDKRALEGEANDIQAPTSIQGRGGEPTTNGEKDARSAKPRDLAPSSKNKYRSKSLLTINPDGSIRPGGLEGKRKPGRPRKETPISAEELPHLTTSYEYHANQRRIGNDQGPSPNDLGGIEEESLVDETTGGCQDIYVQSGELHESNPDLALLMEPTIEHPVPGSSHRYPQDPDVHDQRRDHVSTSTGPSHRDSESSLGQALSHIEYYHVTGPNFGGRANHQSSLPRSHVLNNIAPHFPLPPPGHRDPTHQPMNQEEQQYLSDFGSRMPVIGSYSGHFPGQTGQGVDSHDPWHEQRDPGQTSSHSDSLLPEGSHVSIQGGRHHVHHTQMDDNPDIVDGIDMEAAFGNPHILADSLGDRGGVGDMSELQMRSFLEGQHSHAEGDDGIDIESPRSRGKRKADEMLEPGESDMELGGILRRRGG